MRFHVVKRDGCPLWKKLGLYVLAVLAALILGGVVLLALGVDPLAYYSRMFTMGMVGNKIAYKTFENYLKVFVPLALTSVALSLAFKMRFWNIGGEGQFILGAVAATTVAFKLAGAALGGDADPYVSGRNAGRRDLRGHRGGAEGEVWHQRDPDDPDAQLCGPVFCHLPGGDPGRLELLSGQDLCPAHLRHLLPVRRLPPHPLR